MIKEVLKENLINFVINDTNSPYRKYYGFFENDDIIGYISVDFIYDRMEIINIFVNDNFRNRKIGSNMIEYVIELAKKSNFINITLEVKEDNYYAICLYKKYKFIEVAIRKNYYNNKNGILMELKL